MGCKRAVLSASIDNVQMALGGVDGWMNMHQAGCPPVVPPVFSWAALADY